LRKKIIFHTSKEDNVAELGVNERHYYEISLEICVLIRDKDWSDAEYKPLALLNTAMNFHVT
jgi:hypothetical protein